MREPREADIEEIAHMLRWKHKIGKANGRNMARDVLALWRKLTSHDTAGEKPVDLSNV